MRRYERLSDLGIPVPLGPGLRRIRFASPGSRQIDVSRTRTNAVSGAPLGEDRCGMRDRL
jgi:hypothetical protein